MSFDQLHYSRLLSLLALFIWFGGSVAAWSATRTSSVLPSRWISKQSYLRIVAVHMRKESGQSEFRSEGTSPKSTDAADQDEVTRISWQAQIIRKLLTVNAIPSVTKTKGNLPPEASSCPFMFRPFLRRGWDLGAHDNPAFGPGYIYYKLSRLVKHSRFFYFWARDKKDPSKKTPVLLVSGYAEAKDVMKQEFDALTSQTVPFTARVIGTNSVRCVTSSKHDHAQVRALVGQSMTRDRIYGYYIPTLHRIAHSIFEKAVSSTNDDEDALINMEPLCNQFTLNVAIRLILGLDESVVPEDEIPKLTQTVQDWMAGIFSSDEDDSWKEARAYLVNLIECQMQRIRDNPHRPAPGDKKKTSTTLETLMEATVQLDGQTEPRRLTHEEIIDNTLLLILAGADTSSGTLTACCLLLGLQPNVWDKAVFEQQKIVQEKRNSLNQYSHAPALSENAQSFSLQASSCSPLSLERSDLENSVFADSIIRETLRLKPIVGGSMRGTTRSMRMMGGKYEIPAGWAVKYDRYLTHLNDPKTHLDDETHMDVKLGFKPERWLNESTRPGSDFIPFGVGPRYCLGSELAMVEMKVFLLEMIRMFGGDANGFELVDPSPKKPINYRVKSLVPVPEQGVWVRVHKKPLFLANYGTDQ